MNFDPNNSQSQSNEVAPAGFDQQGWPLPEVRSMMVENFSRSWTKHWIAAIVIFFVSVTVVIFSTLLATPTWEGSATVLITPTALPQFGLASSGMAETAPISTGMLARNLGELIRDHALQYEVIEMTGLDDYIEQRSKNPREKLKERLKNLVMLKFLFGKKKGDDYWVVKAKKELDSRWLAIAPAEGTSKLPLFVYGTRADKTIEVGNAVLEKVQEYMDRSLRAGIEKELLAVAGLIDTAETDIARAEADITSFRQELGYFNTEMYANALQDYLNTLDREASTLVAQQIAVSQNVAETVADLQGYEPFILVEKTVEQIRPDDRASQRIEIDLADLRSELAAALVTAKPTSPQVQQLQEKIDTIEAALEEARKNEAGAKISGTQLAKDWDPRYKTLFERWLDARAQLLLIDAKMTAVQNATIKMQENLQKSIVDDTKLTQMNRRLRLKLDDLNKWTSKQQSYTAMLAQDQIFNGMQVIETMGVNTPGQADRPNKLMAAIMAIAIGLFMALVLPVAFDYLNQTLLSSRQASTIPGLRLGAVVPKMNAGQMTKSMSV